MEDIEDLSLYVEVDEFQDTNNGCPKNNNLNEMNPVPPVSLASNPLIITQVVLENFKSYGGKHIVGPFHHKFSSIIGPNGSGKSNIIDAMLFVFGRRAQQLRHKSLAGLIHKSSSYPNLQYARVSVYFKKNAIQSTETLNEQDCVMNSDTEFVVAREASIDGTSRFTINQCATTQKEVIKLLKSYGIDLDHNRFLILQGEVEQIALMKPKGQTPQEEGLLEYLEDIIGSNQYIPDILVAKEDLSLISEKIQERREKLLAAQSQVTILKEPLRIATESCLAERYVLTLKSQLEQKAQLNVQRKLDSTQTELDCIQSEWDEWIKQREEEKKKSTMLQASLKKQQDIVSKAEAMMNEAEMSFNELERIDNELAAKQSHCVKRVQTLQKECAAFEKEKLKCISETDSMSTKVAHLKQQIPDLRENVALLQTELEALDRELQSEFETIRIKKEKAERLLQPEIMKLANVVASVDMSKAKMSLIEEKREGAIARHLEIETKLNESSASCQAKDQELNEIKKKKEKLKKQYTKRQDDVLQLRHQLLEQRDHIQNLRSQIELKENVLHRSRSDNLMIPRVLAAKEDGRLHGVIDRLWNLGSIDSAIENAMASVAGSEYILVEETVDAEKVVEFVRTHHLGRVTCIVLSRIKSELSHELKALRKKKIPHGAKLLLDQVKLTLPIYEIAFYFVLRDILLVDTLDQARRIAFDGSIRWRVVTMEGQVIDKAGTMSGGGVTAIKPTVFKRKHAIGTNTTQDNEIKNIESIKLNLRDSSAALEETKNLKTKAEQEITTIEAELNRLQDVENRSNAELDASKQDVKHYSSMMAKADIPELSSKDQEELKKLANTLHMKEKEMSKQKEIIEKYQSDVDCITKEIESVGGGRRQRTNTNLINAQKNLEKILKDMEDTEIQTGVQKKRVEALTILIPNKSKEIITELDTEKTYAEERNQLTDKAEIILHRKEELEKIVEEQRAEEKKKQQELKEHFDAIKNDGLTEVSYETKLQDLQHVIGSFRHALLKHQKQLKKLKDDWNLIPVIHEEEDTSCILDLNESDNVKEIKTEPVEFDNALPETILDTLDEVMISCEIKKTTESRLTVKADMFVIEKHHQACLKYKEKKTEFEEVCHERDLKAKQLDSLELSRLRQFTAGFVIISSRVKELYQMITNDGDAELELADPCAPFEAGIVFSIRPPKKSWKRIQNLSGGEKTLSSLALVFALHHFRPTPIYFLDEIDAALDHRNVSTIALYIANQAKDAQFIIISLRNHMFEVADRLVGIYKIDGITHSTTIDPDNFVEESEKGSLKMLEASSQDQNSVSLLQLTID